ncbi:hypothetical protein DSO57_1001681 [Entomophthora muscae]|uniref:Uncharacterized protein n=1 Tax=Entomophthora muscae TaxID=34485 RepID=A0ACC2TWS3_9FUNG|nr:hypothetical protein DSO57_1001681 [Entomophthora muscae]
MLPRFACGIHPRGGIPGLKLQSPSKILQVYGFTSGRVCLRGPLVPRESKPKPPMREKEEKNLWPGIMEPSKAIMGLEAETVFRLPSPQSATIQKLLGDYKLIMSQHKEDDSKVSPASSLVSTAQLPQTPDAVDGVAATMLEEKVEMDRQEIDMASFITKSGADDDMFYADPSMFQLGDLVFANSMLGIIVSKTGRRFVLLTPIGSFITANSFSIRFHLPRFLETKPANDMIEATLSQSVVTRFMAGEAVEQALPLLARLIGQVDMRASSFTMKNHQALLDLASKYQHPDKQVEVKISTVAQSFLGHEPEPYELVGLFRFMASNTVEFAKCQEKRNTLVVHSKTRVSLYNELLELAAKPHSLNPFINKAAKLIKYRTQRFPNPHPRIVNTSYLGFSPHTLVRAQNHTFPPCSDITFTSMDQKIICGIWDFISTEKITNVSPLLPLVTAILKPLRYSYVCALDALEFLKDIGVLRPWENPWFADLPPQPTSCFPFCHRRCLFSYSQRPWRYARVHYRQP